MTSFNDAGYPKMTPPVGSTLSTPPDQGKQKNRYLDRSFFSGQMYTARESSCMQGTTLSTIQEAARLVCSFQEVFVTFSIPICSNGIEKKEKVTLLNDSFFEEKEFAELCTQWDLRPVPDIIGVFVVITDTTTTSITKVLPKRVYREFRIEDINSFPELFKNNTTKKRHY